ncbi:hypothetical protein BTUL_0068g00600 [Botrytis tulipae]|uniref:Rhodopsin domain-containing protein n=1 Tax=Botrytis tulipae TaxID=87230 RepID=A0A4Z1EWQ5_9HELO|nr:hypothetical protein BTUL_0068g00600 [Botrytis tulipae]
MGHHLLWIQPAKLVIGLKLLYAIDLINVLALSIPKLALLFLYKRLFIISKPTNHAIKGAAYAVYLFIIVFEAIAIFQCVPISDAFKTGPRKSHRCIGNTVVLTWATVPSIMTDIVIFLIPVPMHMPDLTYVGGESLLWLQIQPATYLICACSLRCRPLLEAIIGTISYRSPKMLETPANRSVPMTSVKIGILEGVADERTNADNIEITKMVKVHLG